MNRFQISIETNDNSEAIFYADSRMQALKLAKQIKTGQIRASEYSEIENPHVCVYNRKTHTQIYCSKINKKALKK